MKTTKEEYSMHEVVWAKVGAYPWWPAKITSAVKRTEKHQYIQKVSFFADPTYAYVPLASICAFDVIPPQSHSSSSLDFKLRKAVQLAHIFQNKQKHSKPPKILPPCTPMPTPYQIEENISIRNVTSLPNACEVQSAFCTPSELIHSLSQQPQVQAPTGVIFNQSCYIPTPQNILEVLHARDPLLHSYCYSMRKEAIRYENHLQYLLLKRYSLENIQKQLPLPKRKIIHKARPKPILRKTISQFEEVRQACGRRMHQLIRNRQFVETMMLRMSSVSEGNCYKMKSLFVAFVKNLRGETQDSAAQCFNDYLDKLEGEKNIDEEGSKMTQISVHAS